MEKRERRSVTMRLLPADKELIQDLARDLGYPDRYLALLALVPIVRKLTFEKEERKPFKFGLPAELEEALREKAEEQDVSQVQVLLAAARKLREQTAKKRR